MSAEFEVYGYAIEAFHSFSGHYRKGFRKIKFNDGYWDRYNRKIYDSEEKAKMAWENNPYKQGDSGFMHSYKIIHLYKIKGA